MKFTFKYEPKLFREYVQKNFSRANWLPYPNYERETFVSRLARLRGQVDMQVDASDEAFRRWMEQLDHSYKMLLPFVYEDFETDVQRKYALLAMQSIVQEEKVVFAHLLQQCYATNTFVPYWLLLTRAYQANPERYNAHWPSHVKEQWAAYIRVQTNHVEYVGDKMLQRIAHIEGVLDDYFIRPEHAFYREVLVYVFERGPIELFQKERSMFRQLFEEADQVTAQRLATGFIRAEAMVVLEKESQLIFDRLHTYVKRPLYWNETPQDAKEAFHRWYLGTNLREFFGGIDQNHERFEYWETFIPRMKDALVLEDNKTILFYFEDVVIMEVLGMGAVYVYEANVFEGHFGHYIRQYREALESEMYQTHGIVTYHLDREMIRDKALVYRGGWLSHSGAWQGRFDEYLERSLGWEVT